YGDGSGVQALALNPDKSFALNHSYAVSGVYTVTVTVSDEDGGIGVTSVLASPNNEAPVLDPIADRSVSEGSLLTFTVTATDTDVPINGLTYSLDDDAPAGAAIDPQTGVFSWTPTEAQGPGSYDITVRVTDDGAPALDDTRTFTITVTEVNGAPLLVAIGNVYVDQQSILTFAATATDADQPANGLTFSLDAGAPDGATIDALTGVFSWTPTAAQGPGDYSVTVRVTDDGTPVRNDFETIVITVGESNVAPVLAGIGDQITDELTELSFTVSATDGNAANTLTYSLDGGAPAGASIDSVTGEFRWTPTEVQGPGSFSVTVRVTDDGTQARDDFETIVITVDEVNGAPDLDTIGDQFVAEGLLLAFVVSAVDPDGPDGVLTFSLDAGAPAGATIDSATGVFSWAPTQAQGLGEFSVTIRVIDDGTPSLDDAETITITVGTPPLVPPADPRVLGQVDGNGVLTLNVGPAEQRALRNLLPDVEAEQVYIDHVGSGSVTGESIRITLFGVSQTFDNVTSILITDMGAGNDFVQISSGVSSPVEVHLGAGADTLISAGSGSVRAFGDDGDDRLTGGTGNDTLFGGSGQDDLRGGAGNDTLWGGADGDRLEGEAGQDTLYGGGGIDFLVLDH
ncbi:hypothetical protein EYC98_21590, partial [Halieaceae bacterium IMCC14734]